jgi:hypothetical protein
MLERKTYTALRRIVKKALDEAKGDPEKAFSLARKRLHTGTTRDRDLREAIVENAVILVLNDITMEGPEKVKGGLMNINLPV